MSKIAPGFLKPVLKSRDITEELELFHIMNTWIQIMQVEKLQNIIQPAENLYTNYAVLAEVFQSTSI